MDPKDTSEPPKPSDPRKKYERPEIVMYGDLAAITGNLAGRKHNDGSGHPNRHFTS